MKRFICVVLDKNWKTCIEDLEAENAEQARQKLKEGGFSIVHIREAAPGEEPGERTGAGYSNEEPALETPAGRKNGGSGPLFRFLAAAAGFVLLAGLAVLAISRFSLFLKPPAAPEKVVEEYLSLGMQGDWKTQYGLLSRRYASLYHSKEHYASEMEADWMDLGAGRPEEAPVIGPAAAQGARTQVEASLVKNGMRRDLLFILKKRRAWKIDAIRNAAQAAADLRALALPLTDEKRAEIMRRMTGRYGYSKNEVDDLVSHLSTEEEAGDIREGLETSAVPAAAVAESAAPGDDRLQEKLESLIRDMDEMNEKSGKRPRFTAKTEGSEEPAGAPDLRPQGST